MFYLNRPRMKELGPVAPAHCHACGTHTWARLFRIRPWLTFFRLPLLPLSTEPRHELVCENCFAHKPVDGADLDRALEQRDETAELMAGEVSWADYAESVESFSAGVSDEIVTEPPEPEEPRGFA